MSMKALKVMAGALAATEQFAGRDAAEQVPMTRPQS